MKKKIILLTCIIVSAAPLLAQVKKGSIILGTNVNIHTTINNSVSLGKGSNWMHNSQVQVELGKAIKDNTVIGLRFGYGSVPGNEYQQLNGVDYLTYKKNRFVSGSLFFRDYAQLTKNVLLFAEYSISGSTGRFKNTGYDDAGKLYTANMKLKNIGAGLSLGIAYKISNRVMLDLSFNNLLGLRYTSTKGSFTYNNTGQTVAEHSSQFSFDPFSGIKANASFGIKIRLGKQ